MHGYKVRPGYGTGELLIEFDARGSDEDFAADLFRAFERAGIEFDDVRDHLLLHAVSFRCPLGSFEVHLDEWGFYWGHFPEQACVAYVDDVLQRSDRFEWVAVDFAEYARPADGRSSADPEP